MEIHGIQKMTLLDYPEKVACTIFTARCNFRCPFCHNASLVTHVAVSFTQLRGHETSRKFVSPPLP